MVSEVKTFRMTIDSKYVATIYPSKLKKFLGMILEGKINNKTDAEERYFKKISKDHDTLFKCYKMNKDYSNINKMLSYINTFLRIVFGPDFLESNKGGEKLDERDSETEKRDIA